MMSKKIMLCYLIAVLCCVDASSQPQRRRQPTTSNHSAYVKVPKDLLQQLMRDDVEVKSYVQQGLINNETPNGNFRAKLVDLNGDAKPEFIIIPPSGMGGNSSSPIWIYRQQANHYQLLLQAAFMDYRVLNTSTNGYRDLEMSYGGNSMGYDIDTFKFNGTKYNLKSSRHSKTGFNR